ncbi:MAG: hypothetical protein GTO17_14185 [Candidatus Aminicenantes bacterium]|nr:hypothetical protein [Candidatus Aminicenantes bacterium]
MNKRTVLFLSLLILTLLLFFPSPSWSQLVIGQYEDEAPFRTWNTFGVKTASSLARGETQFTLASDCSVALSNPALLLKLPKAAFTLSYQSSKALFYKYSIVNTGVLFSEENFPHQFYVIDFIGTSVRFDGWALAVSWSLLEVYSRPPAEYQYMSGGTTYYSIDLEQKGKLDNINFSLSRRLFKGLSIGFGFNYVYGQLDRNIVEEWIVDRITITDNKSQEYRGYYFNGGLSLDLTDKFRVGAVFRTPFTKKSKSQSSLGYNSPAGDTDIRIEATSNDEYYQPLVIGLGASFEVSDGLRMMSDIVFYDWSSYKVDYFEEPLQRDFKDVIKIGVGAEYESSHVLFNQVFYVPWRVGFIYDPQPMKEPSSSYLYFTFGSGIRWKRIVFDAAFIIGQERGSEDSLSANKVAFTLSYLF